MPASEQLGIYWGVDSFSIVGTVNGQITDLLKIPFENGLELEEGNEDAPDDLKFSAILKKALEFRSIKATSAHLSLPTNDLIFRSFTIPLMSKSDIRNVVEFEITKYIPLKLEDLVYTYHTIPHTENKQKNLKVLFIAIRKNRLEEMVKTITQAGLTLNNIEPAQVSLIHLLKKYKFLSKKGSTSILILSEEGAEIVVVKDETLSFMRKLNTRVEQSDMLTLQSSLQNEVRVSFNFFLRQNHDDVISKMVIISQHEIPNIKKILSADLGVPVSFVPLEKFIPIEDQQSVSHLSALGTMLRKEKFSTKFFDLSDYAVEMQRSGKDPLEVVKRYSLMAGVLLGCVLAICLTMIYGNRLMVHKKAQAAKLKSKIGSYGALSIEDLTAKKSSIFSKLKNYTDIRTDSYLSLLLLEIPPMLPKGAWLDSFEVSYDDSATNANPNVKIVLSGKVYSEDLNEQFFILSEIIKNLKENKTINKYYKNVNRSNAERVTEDGHAVTTFTITCDPK